MPLNPGTTLGPYAVTAKIGEGGMGEVYQARDTTLDRDVALKVLPEAFTSDPDRLARFEREAKVLASLNHPNIGSIYGLEEAEGVRALVLELIEGPTLADRIKQGPIPIDEALPIAKQIAEALEAAHEAGVIHRDLKPANVKVKPDGTVKVLDFGLAKAFQAEPGSDPSESPTMTAAATRAGVIMGTAAYMSPEQAKGKPADRRSDIWAFGCVLYEMLTGTRTFGGGNVSEVLAEVIKSEPDWETLPSDTPQPVRRLLRRCLRKPPQERLHHVADVRLELAESAEPGADTGEHGRTDPSPFWRRALPVGLGIAMVGMAIALVALWVLSLEPTQDVTRFVVTASPSTPVATTEGNRSGNTLAITPDGTRVIYRASGGGLHVRAFDQLESVPLRGAEDAVVPFGSPNGAWVGFLAAGSPAELQKVPIEGGPPVTICEVPGSRFSGASWGPDDLIIFSTRDSLWRVSATGGEPERIATSTGGVEYRRPEILPDGKSVLFALSTGGAADDRIAVLDLMTGEEHVVIPNGASPRYSQTGHVVYSYQGTLRAVGFDLKTLRATTEPIPVQDDVFTVRSGSAKFDLSDTGTLVYLGGGGEVEESILVWIDRDGNETAIAAEPRRYVGGLRLSPSGQQAAVVLQEDESDVYVYDLPGNTLDRLTFDPGADRYPLWSPDGAHVLFSSDRAGGLPEVFWTEADGTGSAEPLTSSGRYSVATSFLPDGETLLLYDAGNAAVMSLAGDDDRAVDVLLNLDYEMQFPEISHDGRWMAYMTRESGRAEVYVRPFPSLDRSWQVSRDGGRLPVWGPDGRELFYRGLSDEAAMMVVPYETEPTFRSGTPRVLFEGSPLLHDDGTFGVSSDGQRFLMLMRAAESARLHIIGVQNWHQELLERVPIP